VLQSVAVALQMCCRVLQCVAECCRCGADVLQGVAVCCSVLQSCSVCCGVLQRDIEGQKGKGVALRCNWVAVVLQMCCRCVADVLQGVAGCCSVLQSCNVCWRCVAETY